MMKESPAPPLAWIVEDDDLVYEVLARLIAEAGYGVVRSATFKQALERLRAPGGISLVVLDFRLPDGSGRDLLPMLAQLPEPPDVAVITGFGTMEDAVEALRYGVSDFITKPFDTTDIKGMLRRVTTRQQLRVGFVIRHLDAIEQRFQATHKMLAALKADVDELRDFVHAAFQRKNHA